MIIAVESLILNKPISDAIKRAYKYVEAGADGIMYTVNQVCPMRYLDLQNYLKNFPDVPLVLFHLVIIRLEKKF